MIDQFSFGCGRMYHQCCATYESASLRMFRLGRTDTIRSASNASAAFVKSFDDHHKQVRFYHRMEIAIRFFLCLNCRFLLVIPQNTENVDLLVKAVNAHRSYTNMVSIYSCMPF